MIIGETWKCQGAYWVIAAATALLWASPAAGELKIGYIDSGRVLANSRMFQQARQELERYEGLLNQEAEAKQREIEALNEQLEIQQIMLTEERKAELEEQIRAKMEDLQRFVNEVVAPRGKLVQKSAELNKPIFDKVQAILDRLGEEGDYDLVFDTVEGNIVFAKQEYDLTDRVIDELRKQEMELGLIEESDTTATAQPPGLAGSEAP
jgi:outer membrane protein